MPKIQDSTEVQVPVRQAYNQWTQFEEFPKFMEGIQSVQQLDDTHVQWVAEIGGKSRQWTTEITEQQPDKKVAWKTTSCAEPAISSPRRCSPAMRISAPPQTSTPILTQPTSRPRYGR